MVGASKGGNRDDGGEGITLQPPDQPHAGGAGIVPVDEQQTGVPSQDDRLHLRRLVEHQQRERVDGGPLANQGRRRTTVRRKEENRRASPHPWPLVRSYI